MSGMKRTAVSAYCSDPNDRSYDKISQAEMNRYRGKRVIRAEKWQCPLENAWAALYAVGIGHQAVVVTIEDPTIRFIVHKLPSEKNDGKGEVLIAYAAGMGRNWSRFDQKEVKKAKLGDYLEACGFSYHKLRDNCMHAVGRMWELD